MEDGHDDELSDDIYDDSNISISESRHWRAIHKFGIEVRPPQSPQLSLNDSEQYHVDINEGRRKGRDAAVVFGERHGIVEVPAPRSTPSPILRPTSSEPVSDTSTIVLKVAGTVSNQVPEVRGPKAHVELETAPENRDAANVTWAKPSGLLVARRDRMGVIKGNELSISASDQSTPISKVKNIRINNAIPPDMTPIMSIGDRSHLLFTGALPARKSLTNSGSKNAATFFNSIGSVEKHKEQISNNTKTSSSQSSPVSSTELSTIQDSTNGTFQTDFTEYDCDTELSDHEPAEKTSMHNPPTKVHSTQMSLRSGTIKKTMEPSPPPEVHSTRISTPSHSLMHLPTDNALSSDLVSLHPESVGKPVQPTPKLKLRQLYIPLCRLSELTFQKYIPASSRSELPRRRNQLPSSSCSEFSDDVTAQETNIHTMSNDHTPRVSLRSETINKTKSLTLKFARVEKTMEKVPRRRNQLPSSSSSEFSDDVTAQETNIHTMSNDHTPRVSLRSETINKTKSLTLKSARVEKTMEKVPRRRNQLPSSSSSEFSDDVTAQETNIHNMSNVHTPRVSLRSETINKTKSLTLKSAPVEKTMEKLPRRRNKLPSSSSSEFSDDLTSQETNIHNMSNVHTPRVSLRSETINKTKSLTLKSAPVEKTMEKLPRRRKQLPSSSSSEFSDDLTSQETNIHNMSNVHTPRVSLRSETINKTKSLTLKSAPVEKTMEKLPRRRKQLPSSSSSEFSDDLTSQETNIHNMSNVHTPRVSLRSETINKTKSLTLKSAPVEKPIEKVPRRRNQLPSSSSNEFSDDVTAQETNIHNMSNVHTPRVSLRSETINKTKSLIPKSPPVEKTMEKLPRRRNQLPSSSSSEFSDDVTAQETNIRNMSNVHTHRVSLRSETIKKTKSLIPKSPPVEKTIENLPRRRNQLPSSSCSEFSDDVTAQETNIHNMSNVHTPRVSLRSEKIKKTKSLIPKSPPVEKTIENVPRRRNQLHSSSSSEFSDDVTTQETNLHNMSNVHTPRVSLRSETIKKTKSLIPKFPPVEKTIKKVPKRRMTYTEAHLDFTHRKRRKNSVTPDRPTNQKKGQVTRKVFSQVGSSSHDSDSENEVSFHSKFMRPPPKSNTSQSQSLRPVDIYSDYIASRSLASKGTSASCTSSSIFKKRAETLGSQSSSQRSQSQQNSKCPSVSLGSQPNSVSSFSISNQSIHGSEENPENQDENLISEANIGKVLANSCEDLNNGRNKDEIFVNFEENQFSEECSESDFSSEDLENLEENQLNISNQQINQEGSHRSRVNVVEKSEDSNSSEDTIETTFYYDAEDNEDEEGIYFQSESEDVEGETLERSPVQYTPNRILFSNSKLASSSQLRRILGNTMPNKKFSTQEINNLQWRFNGEAEALLDEAASINDNVFRVFTFKNLESTLRRHKLIGSGNNELLGDLAMTLTGTQYRKAKGLVIPNDGDRDTYPETWDDPP